MPRKQPIHSAGSMTAQAALATECVRFRAGRALSRVQRLRSKTPLVLRPAHPKGPEPLVHHANDVARVALASGAAGPLGGDDLALDIQVGAGSALVFSEISATLLLPGARGGRSRMRISVHVEDNATFVWLPEPVIAAHDCDHVHDIDIKLTETSRLFMRDELLLGRHREQSGDLAQNIRIERNKRPLVHQQLRFGPGTRGCSSPAVLGPNQCIGTVLAVDPAWDAATPAARSFADNASLLPLAGPAVMLSALGPETLSVRRLVEQGMSLLGEPWTPAHAVSANAPEAGIAQTAGAGKRQPVTT